MLNLAAIHRELTGPAIQTVLLQWLHHLMALCSSVVFYNVSKCIFSAWYHFLPLLSLLPALLFQCKKKLVVVFSLQHYWRCPFASWIFCGVWVVWGVWVLVGVVFVVCFFIFYETDFSNWYRSLLVMWIQSCDSCSTSLACVVNL